MKGQRRELDRWLSDRRLGHTFSLTSYGVYTHAVEHIHRHARGVVLDAGAGRAPYKQALVERGVQLITVDIENRSGDVTHLADIQDLAVIDSESIDTVICTNVLEHVPRPWDAVHAMARVLKPGGRLILSVPHLTPLHELPHDYFRYTSFGVSGLLERGGFDVEQVTPVGGLLAFLGHGASHLFLSLAGAVPGLRKPAWAVNFAVLVRLLGMLDELSGLEAIYPCDYVVLARRRATLGPQTLAANS